MPIYIAVAPIDPARNELTRAFVRSTQEDAEAMAAINSRSNEPWTVYELVEVARTVVDPPRLVRSREPPPRPVIPNLRAGEINAD